MPNNPEPPSSSRISDADLQKALDLDLRESLRPIAIGLAALYLVYTISHALLMSGGLALVMVPVAGMTCVALLGLSVALGRHTIPSRWAHPVATAIALLAFINSILHLYLTGESQQTTNLMLLIIGVGAFFLSIRWFAGVIAVVVAAWMVAALMVEPSPAWVHFGFALFTATVISIMIHIVRVRVLRRLESMRWQDERRKHELEDAIRELQHSEERFRQLSEASFEGVAVHERGKILDANKALARMFGYETAEMIGMPILQLLASRTMDFNMIALQAQEKPFATVGVKKDGATFPIEISCKAIPYQGRTAIVAAMRSLAA